MKHFLKTTVTLLTAALLCAALMTGCTRLTEAKDNTPSTTGTPSAAGEFGVYVKLERDDANSVYIHGGSFSKVCENADGSLKHVAAEGRRMDLHRRGSGGALPEGSLRRPLYRGGDGRE